MTRLRVVIAGGGVAGLEAMLALRELARERVDIELVAPEPRFWYRPLAVVEPFGLGDARSFDLGDLAAKAGAGLTLGEVVAVDPENHSLRTAAGADLSYDVLVLACGALPRAAVGGALTFRGPADTTRIATLLRELARGAVSRVAIAVPLGSVWSLPAYELALLFASDADARRLDVEVALVTPEDEPLSIFGAAATEAVRHLLESAHIALHTSTIPIQARERELAVVPGRPIAADRVVALPRLFGRRIDGIPQSRDGFVAVDTAGCVIGFADVYAAGDVTNFPLKQGGLAAQQADAVAEEIAAHAGAPVRPRPFRPILRGQLLTGGTPRFLKQVFGEAGAGEVSIEPLWWPPAKIVGRYLAPALAAAHADADQASAAATAGGLDVRIELSPEEVARLERERLAPARSAMPEDVDEPAVAELMSRQVLVVAPEDTLGEVAEKMVAQDLGSALVAEWGSLVGILTSRDLLRAVAYRVHPSETRVRRWMTAAPIAVAPNEPASAALRLMTDHSIHHLPVVDGDGIAGIVGMRALIRVIEQHRRVAPPVGLGF